MHSFGSAKDVPDTLEHLKFSSLGWLLLAHGNISQKYGYVYIDTPKVACSTIKYSLQEAELGARRTAFARSLFSLGVSAQNVLARAGLERTPLRVVDYNRVHDKRISPLRGPTQPQELDEMFSGQYLIFAFIRNPFTRVLSAYLDKVLRVRKDGTPPLFVPGQRGERPSFGEFLRAIAAQDPEQMDMHWRPQHVHLCAAPRLDFLGSFEDFVIDFKAIARRIHQDLPRYILTIDPHRTNAANHVATYYADREAVRLVQKIYREDFEKLGYEPDLQRAFEPPGAAAAQPLIARSRAALAVL